MNKFLAAAAVLTLAAGGGLTQPPPAGPAQAAAKVRELEGEKARLEGLVRVETGQAETFTRLARDLDKEASDRLRENPPQFSTAAEFRALANEARSGEPSGVSRRVRGHV